MADTAVVTAPMSTHDVSTASRRSDEQQCRDRAEVSFSSKQKELVEKTWGTVEEVADLQSIGYILFRKIFDIAPGAIELFPKFRDVPADERESNEDYSQHALQVVEAVQLAVQSLDDLPGLVMILKDLGSIHCLHNVQDAHFDAVGQAFLWTLEQGLGEEFTPEVKDAWTAFYGMIATNMKQGLHKAQDAQNE